MIEICSYEGLPLALIFLWFSHSASVIGTDNCCTSTACTNYKAPASVYCLGGTGSACEKIIIGDGKVIKITPVPWTDNKDGTVTMFTSVGSIMHDACCAKYPFGMMCNPYNFNVSATLNPASYNRCACGAEWTKAVLNVLSGNGWNQKYSTKVASNKTIVGTMRKAILPIGLLEYDTARSSYGLNELASTAKLCAPSGTRLDCSKNDPNCLIGSARFSKTFANGVVASDSDFCCSKKYKSVNINAVSARWGVCY